jgi:hypothetical protein
LRNPCVTARKWAIGAKQAGESTNGRFGMEAWWHPVAPLW